MLNQSSNETGAMTQAKFSEKVKYAGSNLETQDLIKYKNKLSAYMMAHEKFLDSELSIIDSTRKTIDSSLLTKIVIWQSKCICR